MILSFMISSFNNEVWGIAVAAFSATAELILRNTKHLEMFEMTINNLDK